MIYVLTMPFSKQLFDNFSGVPIQGKELSDLISNHKPKYDDVMECLQFGICSTRPFLKGNPLFSRLNIKILIQDEQL